MKYLSNIYLKFHEVLKKNDGLTVGEKLYSIQKEIGLEYLFASDQDVFEAMERYLSHEIGTDDPLSTEEFNIWVENKFEK